MNPIVAFDRQEYEKLIEMLGLQECPTEEGTNFEEFFNAWHFGHVEEDCDYVVSASLQQTTTEV